MFKKFWIGLNKKDFSILELFVVVFIGAMLIQVLPGCH